MARDIQRIRPAELVRLLNSTRLGEVITERRLYRHRQRAGLKISDGECIHLLRYAAWLAEQVSISDTDMPDDAKKQQYRQHREAAARRQADMAEAGQDIGDIPAVVDPKRRAACESDFRRFCETYFANVFYLRWSDDHLRAIGMIERSVLNGELFALAMPRGSGKSALCRSAVIWAVLYGHHQFPCLIGATQAKARKELAKICNALERNPSLVDDFPEVCYPIRALERSPQRAKKQKCNGEYTLIVWTKDEIVLPSIYGSAAAGAIITTCGLTGGEIRGQNMDLPDGSIIRPSLVLLDDPQTKASARSRTQTEERLELLQGDVLGMAGPDRNIAGMMPLTVIEPGDMADQILDGEQHPDWHGERTKMVYAWPTDEKLWDEYAALWAEGKRRKKPDLYNAFYRKNRAAMDAGAQVAWPDRFPPDCLSAIQHAMNLRLRNEHAFFAEYQNEPLTDEADEEALTAEQIAEKLNNRRPGAVPTAAQHLVAYIDVHAKLLYYTVVALEDDFTGYVVDYGTWPDQKKHYFTMRSVRKSLKVKHQGKGEEEAIYAGLEALGQQVLARSWRRDDGAEMHISLALIDSGYQKDLVELYCRQSPKANILLPAKGLAVTASNLPLDERKAKRGEKQGDNWRITSAQGQYSVRLVLIDTNYWKSFLHERLAVGMGGRGCLSLWGSSQTQHRMIAEHLTAEYRVRTEGRGRKVDEWKLPPHRPDNHLMDCATGCMVAGSMVGCRLLGVKMTKPKRRTRKRKKATYI